MLNIEQIKEKLTEVIYPGFTKNIIDFGFVNNIEINNNEITINLDIPSASL